MTDFLSPGAQMKLFRPSLAVADAFKAACGRAMKACNLSREQIADAMNQSLEAEGSAQRVTAAMLDRWAAASDKKHGLRADLAPALCKVTGNTEPLEVLLRPLGLSLAGPRERAYMEIGQAHEAKKKNTRREKAAWRILEEMKK